MDESLSTQTSLLVRLRDEDDAIAWRHFVGLYAPLVYKYARKHDLQDADALDFTQEVLHEVSRSIKNLDYDPARGSFRGWLFTITHRALGHFLKRRLRQVQGAGDSNVQARLQEIAAPSEDQWERDFQKRLFLWAKDQIRPEFTDSTWQAFWRTAVEEEPITEVAKALGITAGAVYIARSRVQARLREKIQQALDD